MMSKINQIFEGDCLEVLKTFPDNSIDCVVTSPPYWALRDYGVDGQLGLEPTFHEYINKLCAIFDEVKRVLKVNGTVWVNLGDTYSTVRRGNNPGTSGRRNRTETPLVKKEINLFEKSLCCIPDRFKIEMVNRGWICRNEIIWHKPNCMPSAVKDRFTVDFEKVFFFVKSKAYYFKTQYIPLVENSDMAYRKNLRIGRHYNVKDPYVNNNPLTYSKTLEVNPLGKNKRCVWSVPTKPFKEAHFATYPEKLIEPMIDAGCPAGGVVLDMFFGAGTTGLVAKKQGKNYIGIELNYEYVKIARERLGQEVLL